MSIIKMNKNYTNMIFDDTVCQIIDNTLTNAMENIIIKNNDKDKSKIRLQMKSALLSMITNEALFRNF